ncbi:MAG TPA: TetR/AcrR family transcriptional regulator [Terriglobales bacterium]|nr:TetR/AcrR family transcriptional regulator [Terriglobales bacterium]
MHNEGNSSARILDAALKLFSQRGYEGTSTREICELAGITKPTLYYFFESKEGVYRALVRTAFEEYEEIVESGLSTPGGLREKLKKVAELEFERTRAKPELVRFVFSLVYSVNSPFVQVVQTFHETMVARLHEAVSHATRAGEFSPGDVNVRMTVLIGALVEAISNYLITGKPRLTRELAHSIIDTVLDGWGRRNKGSK